MVFLPAFQTTLRIHGKVELRNDPNTQYIGEEPVPESSC